MERKYFSIEKEGFFGAYYTNPKASDKAMIFMLGDDIDDKMVLSGVKWAQKLGCNVMAWKKRLWSSQLSIGTI